MAIPISYNVRNVMQRPAATLATMLGVAFTVTILIAALALAEGFQRALRTSGSPENVMVLRKGADSEISSGLSRDAVNVLRALPDVATDAAGRPLASPEVVVLVNKPRLGQPGSSNVTVRGVDPEGFTLRSGHRVVEGRMFSPGAAEVVIGHRIARRFANCEIGESIRFGQQDFKVVGHFESGGSSFESEIWGDNRVLMPVFRGEVFQSMTFRLRDPARFEAVKRQIESDPRLQAEARRESQFYADQSSMLSSVMRIAGVVIVLIMGVGAMFGAMNTMFAAVGARTREIATLLILGFSPAAVMASFLVESVILALLGGVLGCLLSLTFNGIVTSTTNFQSFSEVVFAFHVTPGTMLAGLVFAGVMGVVGGFLPALHAARQPLAKSVREM